MECIFFESPPLDVYGQMALDEALINALPSGACALRIFNWAAQPGATFGYAQFEASAAAQIKAAGIKEYTRRPTGGGVVLHRDDLTFSLFFPSPNPFSPAEIYGRLHALIKAEFAKNNTVLGAYNQASDYRPAPGGVSANCFTNPVSDDLLSVQGDKVLGGAIRRFGDRVLYQGSLQLEGARQNSLYGRIIEAGAQQFFNAQAQRQAVGNNVLNMAYDLAQKVYITQAWIGKF